MCQGQSMKHVGIFTQTLLGFSFNGYIELATGVVILQHGDMTLNFDPGSHHPMRICMCIYTCTYVKVYIMYVYIYDNSAVGPVNPNLSTPLMHQERMPTRMRSSIINHNENYRSIDPRYSKDAGRFFVFTTHMGVCYIIPMCIGVNPGVAKTVPVWTHRIGHA